MSETAQSPISDYHTTHLFQWLLTEPVLKKRYIEICNEHRLTQGWQVLHLQVFVLDIIATCKGEPCPVAGCNSISDHDNFSDKVDWNDLLLKGQDYSRSNDYK